MIGSCWIMLIWRRRGWSIRLYKKSKFLRGKWLLLSPDPSSEEEPVDDKLDYFSSLYANEDEERASSSKRSNDHILDAERFFVDRPIKSTRPVSPHLLPNPLLRKLFVKNNSAIPSSAGVERLFSTAKEILKPNRCSLKDDNFNKLLFLHESKFN